MNSRRALKFMILLISLLTANLLTIYIDSFFLSYKKEFNKHTFTILGMIVVALIYYPLFSKIDRWTNKFSASFLKIGQKLYGKKTGIYLIFIIAIAILYYLYGKLWFDVNMYDVLIRK